MLAVSKHQIKEIVTRNVFFYLKKKIQMKSYYIRCGNTPKKHVNLCISDDKNSSGTIEFGHLAVF